MNKNYIVPEKLFKELLDSYITLMALEKGGVDNWEWYGESVKDYYKELEVKNMEEAIELFINDLELDILYIKSYNY